MESERSVAGPLALAWHEPQDVSPLFAWLGSARTSAPAPRPDGLESLLREISANVRRRPLLALALACTVGLAVGVVLARQ